MVCRDSKVHNSVSSLFFVDYYKIWSSGRNLVIRLYLEIPMEFVCLVLLDRFWVVHTLFVCMVKLKLLAQFPMDHFSHPVVPSLSMLICCIRLLCDWSFRLFRHITYICCFVASILTQNYTFSTKSFWNNWHVHGDKTDILIGETAFLPQRLSMGIIRRNIDAIAGSWRSLQRNWDLTNIVKYILKCGFKFIKILDTKTLLIGPTADNWNRIYRFCG